jgi:broad specificity phosphatase PhoE
MRLTLIRHAQSVSNAGGLTQPHQAIPLTAHGHTQARALGATLAGPASAVAVSRFVRAQQTALPYCKRFNLDPQIDVDLDEFSLIDAALIEGLDGAQRKPFVQAYWADPDLHRRLGERADTFAEFVERVRRFQGRMDTLADGTVIFGHGIWLAMLQWHLEGQGVTDTAGMRAFREFQLQLPMPNCAVFEVARHGSQPWRMERVQWHAESEYEHG